MSKIPNSIKNKAEKILRRMDEEVTIYLFTDRCKTCEEAKELNREVSKATDKIQLIKKSLNSEEASYFKADKYGKGPVQVVTDEEKQVKFFGLPVGNEFEPYLKSIVDISKNKTKLDKGTKKKLTEIEEDINLKVFVNPSCPHCSKAARAAQMISVENKHVKVDIIESEEYPQLSRDFSVRGVPQVNINDKEGQFTGALPPNQFVEKIKKTVKS